MKMQIGKWGNSLAMRFPRELVERYGLKEGDAIDANVIEAALAQIRKDAGDARRRAALQEIRGRRFALPDDWTFDREDAHSRPALDQW